jgi:hypothetical protein
MDRPIKILAFAALLCLGITAHAQAPVSGVPARANRTLSNLAPTTSVNSSLIPQTNAEKLGGSSNPWGDLVGSQTASGDDAIHYDCVSNSSNTGLLINLIGFPASPATAFSVDCATGNTVVGGSETVQGNFIGNGTSNSFPNGPISSGSTTITNTACPSGVTGAWCAAEGSTAATPTSGADYIRADSTTHKLLYSQNGGAEAPLVATALTTVHSLNFQFGTPGGSAISTGILGYVTIPIACTLNNWDIEVDAGTATVKTLKVATGTAIPTLGSNSISTSGVSISTGTAIHSATLTDFTTTAFSANDIVGADLITTSGVGYINFQLVLACSQ